jgi:hypothetical protein
VFLIATVLALGPALGSLANGQANLALGALTLHVVADLSARRRWRVTLCCSSVGSPSSL